MPEPLADPLDRIEHQHVNDGQPGNKGVAQLGIRELPWLEKVRTAAF